MTANSLYGVREGERCPRCGYRRNEYPHFRTCIPRQKWPADMQTARKPRVVINGKVYDRGSEPGAVLPTLQTNGQVFVMPRPTVPPLDGTMPASVGASSPASVALADVDDAGANQPTGAGPDNQTIYVGDEMTVVDMTRPPETVIVTDPALVSRLLRDTCECGWAVPETSKNPKAAMRMHRAKSKAHKES